jgi:hypothetical protein
MKRSLCTNIARSKRRQPRLQTFLEEVYNAKRLHSSLDYVPPDEFEVAYLRCSCSDGMDSLGALHSFAVNFAVKRLCNVT